MGYWVRAPWGSSHPGRLVKDLRYIFNPRDEVWHWDKFTKDIFKAYINFAIRGKQQESGWPEDCVTNEQKTNTLDSFLTPKAFF